MKFPFILRSQYDDAMKVIDSLNERLDSVHGYHRETVNKLEREQREWNEKQSLIIKECKAEVEMLRIANQAAEATIRESRKWASDTTAANQLLRTQLDAAQRSSHAVSEKYSDLNSDMATLNTYHKEVLAAMRDEIAELKRVIAGLRRKNTAATRKKVAAKKPPAKKQK